MKQNWEGESWKSKNNFDIISGEIEYFQVLPSKWMKNGLAGRQWHMNMSKIEIYTHMFPTRFINGFGR